MIYRGRAYRGHDPYWSFAPTSGEGARLTGGRFNRKGDAALYLSLDPMTAVMEITQGFTNRLPPITLCEYDVDCADIVFFCPTGFVARGPDYHCGEQIFLPGV